MLGTYTKGTSLISSPPSSRENRKAPFSASRLSPLMSFDSDLCRFSLARCILNVFSHLRNLPCAFVFVFVYACTCYLRIVRILFHDSWRSDFMARPWSTGIWMGSKASPKMASLISFVWWTNSCCSCSVLLPPLTTSLTRSSCIDLLRRVLELASELLTRHPDTGIKVSGCEYRYNSR